MNRFPDTVSFLFPVQLEPCPPNDNETTLPSLSLKAPKANRFCQWIIPLIAEFYHCGVSAESGYDCNVWLLPLAPLTELLQKQRSEHDDGIKLSESLSKACRSWSHHGVTHLRLTAAVRYQHLDIAPHIWGHEQTEPDPILQQRAATLTGNTCEYCGYTHHHNRLTFHDSSPENTHDDNITVACSICLLSRHLNRLDANDGVMVYLPEMSPADISRLIRTVVTARREGDERQKKGATMILNWLTAHRAETERFWGTSHPGEFGQALQQSSPALRGSLQQRLRHVALIPNPDSITAQSFSQAIPTEQWAHLYNQYCSQS